MAEIAAASEEQSIGIEPNDCSFVRNI